MPKSNVTNVDFAASKDKRIQKATVRLAASVVVVPSEDSRALGPTWRHSHVDQRGDLERKEDRQKDDERAKGQKSLHATPSLAFRGQRRAKRLVSVHLFRGHDGRLCDLGGRILYERMSSVGLRRPI